MIETIDITWLADLSWYSPIVKFFILAGMLILAMAYGYLVGKYTNRGQDDKNKIR